MQNCLPIGVQWLSCDVCYCTANVPTEQQELRLHTYYCVADRINLSPQLTIEDMRFRTDWCCSLGQGPETSDGNCSTRRAPALSSSQE